MKVWDGQVGLTLPLGIEKLGKVDTNRSITLRCQCMEYLRRVRYPRLITGKTLTARYTSLEP